MSKEPIGEVITERSNGSLRVGFHTGSKTDVEQSHRAVTNINKIMAKYQKTGVLPIRQQMPTYGDFSSGLSFHQMRNQVLQAQADFMSLPSSVRKRFDNDPGKLLDFLNDPENKAEAIELGLVPNPTIDTDTGKEIPPEAPKEPEPPVTE